MWLSTCVTTMFSPVFSFLIFYKFRHFYKFLFVFYKIISMSDINTITLVFLLFVLAFVFGVYFFLLFYFLSF